MFRSTLIAAGAVALCGAGFAQEQLDPAMIRPVTVPIRDAGVFNWHTKQWVTGSGPAQHAQDYFVYRNDCSSVLGAFYIGLEPCADIVEDGRLISTSTKLSKLENGYDQDGVHIASGVALSGATDDQLINSFQFAYCTDNPTGSVNIKVGFYEQLRGHCASGIPVKGKPYNLTLPAQAAPFPTNPYGGTTAYFDFGSAAGFPLPGATVGGNQACWIITIGFNNAGFCMASDGEGTWDNNDNLDQFSWSFEHDMPEINPAIGSGPLGGGEPAAGGWGAGSYNIPAGTDPATGGPCGTGNEAWDGFWVNIDGSAPNVPVACSAIPMGTNCYFFGGWPANDLASVWMVMESNGSCAGCNNRAETYCTAGTSSSGCQALISATGTSSSSATTGFFLNAVAVEGSKDGLFFYGTNGRQANQWGNGSSFQCVVPPVRRTQVVPGVGTNGACDGQATVDLNARWTAKPQHDPGAGAVVQCQFWYRDPQNTSNQKTALSGGIEWTVCP
jgi:hypothetical protein